MVTFFENETYGYGMQPVQFEKKFRLNILQ